MILSKKQFREDILFMQEARKACKEHKDNRYYFFECPVCGGDAWASKVKGLYRGKCCECEMGFKE